MRLLVVSKFSHCPPFTCSPSLSSLPVVEGVTSSPPSSLWAHFQFKCKTLFMNRQSSSSLTFLLSAFNARPKTPQGQLLLPALPLPSSSLTPIPSSSFPVQLLLLLTGLAKRCWTAALTSSISNRNKTQHSKKDKCEKNAGLAASSCPHSPSLFLSLSLLFPRTPHLILVVFCCSPFVSYVRSSLCTPSLNRVGLSTESQPDSVSVSDWDSDKTSPVQTGKRSDLKRAR